MATPRSYWIDCKSQRYWRIWEQRFDDRGHWDTGQYREHIGRDGWCFRCAWWRRTNLDRTDGQQLCREFTVDASGNGFYAGNLSVTGKLTKGSGSFKIDHPLDPANKYLSHSFVESPDMMNVYNGNITTDRHGLATVNLPDYFEALNGDFRYQLTVIGQFAQAIVAKKIAGNRFVVRTSKPGVEVSWQVTGIRHDAYANAYRIPVEEDKAAGEQGYYLHPEVFGQPESKSISASSKAAPSSQSVVADASRK